MRGFFFFSKDWIKNNINEYNKNQFYNSYKC